MLYVSPSQFTFTYMYILHLHTQLYQTQQNKSFDEIKQAFIIEARLGLRVEFMNTTHTHTVISL